MAIFTTLGHAIGATVDMAWDTWWALVLGFTITGAVEVFTTEGERPAECSKRRLACRKERKETTIGGTDAARDE